MKPCDIVFLTPNGRFRTNKKICLSFTSYHPEEWANWTIEGMMIGLVSFFVTNERTTGSIVRSKNERRKLALESLSYNYLRSEFKEVFGLFFDELKVSVKEL